MNCKGQGALEYLLLIGGAVLIAAVVIALLVTLGTQSKHTITEGASSLNTGYSGLQHLANI